MPAVIDDIVLGKKALDVALKGARLYRFSQQPDSLGRLLVRLYADYGRATDLTRDVFYSWRARDELCDALQGVLGGDLIGRGRRRGGTRRFAAGTGAQADVLQRRFDVVTQPLAIVA